MFDINTIKNSMDESLQYALKKFNSFNVGIARSDFFNNTNVNVYGQDVALKSIANVNVVDTYSLSVTPFDKSIIKDIIKSLQEANLGISIVSEANLIRINMPKVTEERRIEMIKILKKTGEDAKVVIRNIRKTGMNDIKDDKNNQLISEDQIKKYEKEIQNLTDDFVNKIDIAVKNQELIILPSKK